jgi:UDP-N-acetylmuramyl pentapeptide phosphotransferase/UDP-N-acetylglucosamine-1-phosphate transferase
VGRDSKRAAETGRREGAGYTARPMWLLLLCFAASFAVTIGVVRSANALARVAGDHQLDGPQKFHHRPVPRIGGAGIVVGVLAGVGWVAWRDAELGRAALMLMLCAVPAFAAGFAEDLTKSVSPSRRLAFATLSAALAVWLVQAVITRTDLPGLDWLVGLPVGAALVTMFVVAGVANAVNIIDGFNGLASMCVVLMLAGLAYVAFQLNDTLILWLALAGIGAVLGFFALNFPAGLVFLGDGGAYFLGFYLAELAILLLHRNDTLSPMFPLLLCIYPVFETLFSIYRRKWLRGQPVGMPDAAHLHSLIYRRFLRWAAGAEVTPRQRVLRNSMTSPYLWVLCSLSVLPAVLWYDSTAILGSFIVLFGLSYVVLYWRIVRFRSPRWMAFRRTR